MLDALKKFAVEHLIRHYRDPSSWAALVVMALAYTHIPANTELTSLVEGILANLVGILLLFMDGRLDPNTGPDGRITPRPDGVPAQADQKAGIPHQDIPRSADRVLSRGGPDHRATDELPP